MRPAASSVALAMLALLLAGCAGPQGPDVPRACREAALQPVPGAAPPAREEVVFATGDGVDVHGTLWTASPAHALVFVHGLNEDRRSWTGLAQAMAAKGFTVLSFDLRGHGESTTRRGQPYEWRSFQQEDFGAMEQDVAAAVEVLRGRSDPPCIGIVGGSLGANLALRVAVTKAGIADAAALLSPGLDYRGVRADDAITRYGDRPVFLAAARGDTFGAQSVQVLAGRASAETVVLVEGDLHGTTLLQDGVVLERLVAWLLGAL